jgi:RNA polymerase sigma-70 factor (ECF subfamily)
MNPTDGTLNPEEFLEHAGWMRRLARGLVVASDGDDLVQDTWVAMLQRQSSEAPNGPWLARVLRNLAWRKHRTEYRRREREARVAQTQESFYAQENVLERAEVHRKLVEDVLGLDEPYRSTILLHFFEGLSPNAIAQKESIPASTVRTRLSRGLQRLRTRLDSSHGGSRRAWLLTLGPLLGPGFSSAAEAAVKTGTVSAAAQTCGTMTTTIGASTLGGIAMTQKTLLVAGTVCLLAATAGIGIGRHTAPFQAVTVAPTEDFAEQAALEKSLEKLRAQNRKAQDENERLSARVLSLEERLAQERQALPPTSAGSPVAVTRSTTGISFGEWTDVDALREADWPALAESLATMNELYLEHLERQEQGLPKKESLQEEASQHAMKVLGLALQVSGALPTNASMFGEFTHPLVAANLMAGLLDRAEVPFTAAQADAVARLGEEYEKEYRSLQTSYDEGTLPFRKVVDELALKASFMDGVEELLTLEQFDAAIPESRDQLNVDFRSPVQMASKHVQTKHSTEPGSVVDDFKNRLEKKYGIDRVALDGMKPAFQDWLNDVEALLEPVPKDHRIDLDAALTAGRAQEDLYMQLLRLPLNEETRRKIVSEASWYVPQVRAPRGPAK